MNEAIKTQEQQDLTVPTKAEIQLMNQQAEARFALTPAGQMLRQFEISQRMGQMFSQGTIVPDVYKGNVANCAIAVDMAMRMGMPPMMVMQNLYVVHGMPAWSSKFLIACITSCGRFSHIDYEMKKGVAADSDDYGCRFVAYAKSDVERKNPLYGPWVTWKMVKAEGWLNKNGSKWKTMPDLMFRYRAAAQWQRLYAPELSMGMLTQEEVYEMPATETAPRVEDVEPVEVEAPALDARKVENAWTMLRGARYREDAATLRKAYKEVYDGDETFRDAIIDAVQTLPSRETPAEAQAPEAAPEASDEAAL